MVPLKILISHAHDERGLAAAWKELIETVSLGMIEVWFSSDTHATGGVALGIEWRTGLYNRLAESDFILAIQTPTSFSRPWIMWECGVASGIDKTRGIIPIVYALGRGDLANPLSTYQVYQGEDAQQVREVCERLLQEAELKAPGYLLDRPVEAYLKTIELYRPRKVISTEQMALWRNRFEELIRSGRTNEVVGLRQSMYSSLGKPFQPVEPAIHELLSRILLEQRKYADAIQEVDYALTLLGDDVTLLHRKALAQVERHNLSTAEEIVQHIISLDKALELNPEIASLQGRIHREKWESTHDTAELDAAIAAYRRAYEADRTQYFPGVNAASLALRKGDTTLAEQIFREVLNTCKELQVRPVVSYWVDFTAGEAYLGQGDVDAAITEYAQGLQRNPAPSPQDRESARKGAHRMVSAKKLPDDVAQKINDLLK